MGKIQVICPYCYKEFETDTLDSYYENLVAQWICGELAPPNNTGYDVIVRIGDQEVTIQVKYSGASGKHKQWQFHHVITKVNPDFLVLFGIDHDNYDGVFLMSYESYSSRGTRRRDHKTHQRMKVVKTTISRKSFIWNYHVSNPEKNLLPKIMSIMHDRQLGLF